MLNVYGPCTYVLNGTSDIMRDNGHISYILWMSDNTLSAPTEAPYLCPPSKVLAVHTRFRSRHDVNYYKAQLRFKKRTSEYETSWSASTGEPRRTAPKSRSAQAGLHMSLSWNRYESTHWSLSHSDVTLRPDQRPLACPGLYYRAYSNWSLTTYPFFYSSKGTDNT